MVTDTTRRAAPMGDPSNNDGKTASLSQALTFAAHGEALASAGMSVVVYHRQGAEACTLRPGGELIVGRVAPADLVVPDRSLSRQHARFWFDDDGVHVEDLGSTNGTWVDGSSIDRADVRPGQIINLGNTTTVIQSLANRPRMGLGGHDQFIGSLEDDLLRARYHGRELSLIMVRSRAAGSHVSGWFDTVRSALRPVDRIAMYSSDTLEVLLHETGIDDARAFADRLVSDDHSDLAFAISTFPVAATSGERLIERGLEELRRAVRETRVCVAEANSARLVDEGTDGWLIAESKRMRDALTMAKRLARGLIPVLLYGETGTGKEVVSRFIHDNGPRAEEPLVAVNCAAIPPQLIESTLFGHEKGAFTGATSLKKGVFEAAHGGTVLLDEIGELPADAQAALLRVLETKTVTRVGATNEIAVDVRILAATHRNLEEMCREGRFREDLLYRLNALTLEIPALRERREEIIPMAEQFLIRANASNGRAIRGFTDEAAEALTHYRWPGNVRELRNTIERAVVVAEHDVITRDDLPRRIEDEAPPSALGDRADAANAAPRRVGGEIDSHEAHRHTSETFRECIERLEAEVIVEALQEAQGNQTEAARILSMPRRTLVHKIKALGIKKLGWGTD